MNKKFLTFGILALVFVSAVLVDYLSNTVQADIEVKSPMVVGISEGIPSWATTECLRADINETVNSFPECEFEGIHDWDESDWSEIVELPVMYTGQDKTFTLYTMSKNIADVEITGFEEAIVTNPLGVLCDKDFESIKVKVDSIYGDLGYGTEHELIGTGGCQQIDGNTIKLGSPDSSLWGIGETDVSKIVVTFNDVIGTYTFTYRVVPVVA